MIRYFASLLEAIQSISGTLRTLVMREGGIGGRGALDGALEDRVRALELQREVWEADVEGLVLKAKGQYKAAAAAESRARTLAKTTDFEEEADEDLFARFLQSLPDGEAEGSEEIRVPPVRQVLAGPDTSPSEARAANRARRRTR